MKRIISITLGTILMFSFNIKAQKTKKERPGSIKYTQLPINPLPKEFKNFIVNADVVYDNKYHRDIFKEGINITGFTKVNNNDYDFIVFIEEYPVQYGDRHTKERQESKKKDGVVTKWTEYYYTRDISTKLKLKVQNSDGEDILEKNFIEATTITGGSSKSKKSAWASFNSKEEEYVQKIPELLKKKANQFLDNKVGFPIQQYYTMVYKVKPKKHSYDDFDKAYEIFLNAYSLMKENENNTEEAMKVVMPAIELWKNALKESDLENRKARINKKVTSAANYNIAEAYLLCKQYEKAIEYYTEASKTGSNNRSIINTIEDLIKRRDANIMKEASQTEANASERSTDS